MNIRTDQSSTSRPYKHLFHCPPREQDQVSPVVDQAAFSEHSRSFLHEFDAKAESVRGTSQKIGASVALLGAAGAAAGVVLGGVSPVEGMIITAIAGIVASLAATGAQVELTRTAQTDFLSDAKVPYLQQADGWLAADFTSVEKPGGQLP